MLYSGYSYTGYLPATIVSDTAGTSTDVLRETASIVLRDTASVLDLVVATTPIRISFPGHKDGYSAVYNLRVYTATNISNQVLYVSHPRLTQKVPVGGSVTVPSYDDFTNSLVWPSSLWHITSSGGV